MQVKKQVRTRHGTIDWFQIGKGVSQGCILLPCLFNLYAEYIIQNAGLDEAQAGIKIAGRNIGNLRYADNTILTAEIREPKSLLMKVKMKSEKVGLKLNIQKMKIMASGPITLRILQFLVLYTVKGVGVVNKAEVDVFVELSCFFYDPVDVGNLISGSSAFSKSSLNICKFLVHVLLKPGLENF